MAAGELLNQHMEDWETLSLTEEEVQLPIWQCIIDNKVVDSECIIVGKKQKDLKDLMNENDMWTLFSDDDLTSSENAVAGAKFVHGISPLELRNYQKELAEKALEGHNTIICAPTGSGKTRIATHIIFKHLKAEGKKKVAFLARTVSLVIQQYKALCKYKPQEYKITSVTGQSKDSMSLKMLLKYNDVIVMTPMILVNNIENKGLHLDKFTLMVFDECHHTRKGEPYNSLMLAYLKLKYKRIERPHLQLPQIVGLTASIGIEESTGEDEAVQSIVDILGNLDTPYLQTVCIHRDELMAIVPKPDEIIQELTRLPQQEFHAQIINVVTKLEAHVIDHAKELFDKEVSVLVRNIPYDKHHQKYGQWAVKLKEAVRKVPMDNNSFLPGRYLIIISEYLLAYNFALDMNDLVEPKDIVTFLSKRFRKFFMKENKSEEENLYWGYFEELQIFVSSMEENRNPNLISLANILMENLVNKGDESRGIIFVKTRALAIALKSWLKRCDIPAIKNLHSNFFTGTNVPVEEGGMTQAKQEEIIDRFTNGDIKVLVATSVAEEGLDIPNCNLVIKYNHVGNEVTTVQTRGRSRKHGGVSVLLAMSEIVQRELANQKRANTMECAIKKVSALGHGELVSQIESYQMQVLQAAEMAEELEAGKKIHSKDISFRMVCSLCRQVGVDNINLRTILGKYRVSIDKNLLSDKHIKCCPISVETMDELEFIGAVYCCGKLPTGELCRHKLGTMIKHTHFPFFAVGIKNFDFCTGDYKRLDHYKKWKKVPYKIEELTIEDIKIYCQLTSINADDTDDESDSDTE